MKKMKFQVSLIILAQVLHNIAANNIPSPPGVITPNIVGGEAAGSKEFPWLVRLHIGNSLCGGTLIDWDLVLTAAHCVVSDRCKLAAANSITAIAFYDEPSFIRQTRTASGVLVHQNYDPKVIKNDIAIIKLSTKFTNKDGLRLGTVVRVPKTLRNGTVAGWGLTEAGSLSTKMMKVVVPIVTDSTCTNAMTNPSGQFCAGEFSRDSCQGDSGGPFMCNPTTGEVCGIVSYGEGCGERGKPGVYTQAFAYDSWIKKYKANFETGTCKLSSAAAPATGKFILVFVVTFALLMFNMY